MGENVTLIRVTCVAAGGDVSTEERLQIVLIILSVTLALIHGLFLFVRHLRLLMEIHQREAAVTLSIAGTRAPTHLDASRRPSVPASPSSVVSTGADGAEIENLVDVLPFGAD